MKNQIKKMKTVGSMMALAGAIGSVPFPALAEVTRKKQTIEGTVKLAKPIAHATVRIYDQNGQVIAEKSDATSDQGFFSMDLDRTALGKLTVEAVTDEGTLLGRVDTRLLGKTETLVHLNAGTTLRGLYQQLQPQLTDEQAEARVRSFLKLPEGLDFNFGIENPFLTSFSARHLMSKAKLNGGFDRYAMDLALEMNGTQNAVRTFPAVKLQGNVQFVSWIGEKLVSGIVSSIGSQMFSAFQNGIGMPDQQTQIFNLLNQVMARLAEIQNSLSQIELAITQANYDVRTGALYEKFTNYKSIVDRMAALNEKAKANTGADGKSKDPVKAADIAKAGNILMNEVLSYKMDFINAVNAQFVAEGTITPLPKVFAQVKWLENQIINQDYFNMVNAQLEQYRSYQAVALALLVDAQRVESPSLADADLTVGKAYIEAEKVVYPDEALFKSKDMKSVAEGKLFYDRGNNTIWTKTFYHYDHCVQLNEHRASHGPQDFYSPTFDQLAGLVTRAKISGNFSDVAKGLGFSKKDAEDTKMVVFGCTYYKDYQHPERSYSKYNWFGNNGNAPWDQYYDADYTFNQVKQSKGMTGAGFYSMQVRDLDTTK